MGDEMSNFDQSSTVKFNTNQMIKSYKARNIKHTEIRTQSAIIERCVLNGFNV